MGQVLIHWSEQKSRTSRAAVDVDGVHQQDIVREAERVQSEVFPSKQSM